MFPATASPFGYKVTKDFFLVTAPPCVGLFFCEKTAHTGSVRRFKIIGVWISRVKIHEFTTILGFWGKVLTRYYKVGYK